MVQIPDNIKPHIDFVVKHHFWLLLPLVPLISLPLVFMANGSMGEQIKSARSQIESRLSSLRSVDGIRPHPNEAWSTDIDARTNAVKQETLAEWQRFWNSQQPLRVWPDSLGEDFVQRAAALKPDGKLPRKLLERYQNSVRAIVRQVPARMGADEAMVDATVQGVGPANAANPAQPMRSNKLVQWSPEDQKRIYASFDWEKPPSTMQVVLAQEELWVYGVLCDSIARVNKVAAGPYNAPIPLVQQLAIGYPAAEDDPGASRGGRIVVPVGQPNAAMSMSEGGGPPPMDGGAAAGPSAPRPPHPRFGGGNDPVVPSGQPAAEGVASPDDALKNWIYVDFNGKPLSAAELATAPDAVMVHLMPFVIRAVIDERHLDAWLVDLASAPVPIDVRQVRINAGAGQPKGMPGAGQPGYPAAASPLTVIEAPLWGAGQPGYPASASGGVSGPAAASGRRHDVVVELRGTMGLATPPDRKVLGIEPAAAAVEPVATANEEAPAPPDRPASAEESAEQPPPPEAQPALEAAAEPAPAPNPEAVQ